MSARRRKKQFITLAIVLVTLLMTGGAALAADIAESPGFRSSDLDDTPVGTSTWVGRDIRSEAAERLMQHEVCQEIENCLPSWLVHSHGALVILALHDHGPVQTGQALIEQIDSFLEECDNGDSGNGDAFATGPDDLFPPAGVEACPTPGLINLHNALIIVAPDDHGLSLTKQALVEQIRIYMGDCQTGNSSDDVFATGPDDLFPPAGIEDCPTIISLPHRPS